MTSSGSTTMASATEPNTSGLAGATASQNRRVRTAAGGQRRPATWVLAGLVAGVPPRTIAAAAPITRCGRYGTTSGSAAHWASTAATTGPSPNPAVSASAERRALSPLPGPSSGDTSCTHAVAAPNTTPEHSPASARPTAITASDRGPSTSSSVASGDSATKGQTTGRRPNRSEAGPPTSRPGIRVSA